MSLITVYLSLQSFLARALIVIYCVMHEWSQNNIFLFKRYKIIPLSWIWFHPMYYWISEWPIDLLDWTVLPLDSVIYWYYLNWIYEICIGLNSCRLCMIEIMFVYLLNVSRITLLHVWYLYCNNLNTCLW